MLRKFPESANPSLEEFLELAVLSERGHPIALEPNSNMRVNENMEYGRLYYLIPALVNNTGGHTPDELFEGECIQLLTDNTIKLYLPTRTGFFEYA